LPGDGRLLVSWANGDVNDRNELAATAPNFGIYLLDPGTRERTLVFDNPNAWDLYAMPVTAREAPPVRPTVVQDPDAPTILGSVDIAVTSLDESVSGGTLDGLSLAQALRGVGDVQSHGARRVRIIEGFSSEVGPVSMFGLTMHEGAAILGETPVYEDGSWEAEVVPLLPYHLQPIDEFGMSIRNQMLWIQAMPGEQRRCGGCHEGRSETILPRMGATTLAQQAGPEDLNVAIADRVELPWYGATSGPNVQDVFERACVSCHSSAVGAPRNPFAGRTYTVNVTMESGEMLSYMIPYLDLSSRTLQVEYDGEIAAYPASYVTLLYPSAMMGEVTVVGAMPPMWVEPGSARTSRLIEVINAQSEDDPTSWAFATAPHPEDVGVTLTPEDRRTLIQSVDLGAQYYSRRNVEGAAMYGN